MIERVAICALTYLRPDGLGRLLDGVDSLDVPDGVVVSTIIVDNDPDASARNAVEGRAAAFATELLYVHEPARGISHARNAAVAAARRLNADAVCFIDDDEWPDPQWLRELLRSAESVGADIVTGPVFPAFETQPPAWVISGGFFDRRRHQHHEQIRYATTSSVLISASCLADRPAPFDPAFGISGGEDTHLFAELRDAGFRTVWCDLAHVYETIPASRVDTRWLLRREYRRGQTLSLSLRHRSPRPIHYVRRVGNAMVQFGQGAGRGIVGLRRGRAGWLRGVKQIVFGAGMLTGLAGRRYQEYETTHGS